MDRFDLEDKITALYSLIDSMNDISYGILEGDLSKDDAANAIDGLAVVTKLKIEKLWDTFIQVHQLDQYNGFGNVGVDYTGRCEPEAYTNSTEWY